MFRSKLDVVVQTASCRVQDAIANQDASDAWLSLQITLCGSRWIVMIGLIGGANEEDEIEDAAVLGDVDGEDVYDS